MRSVRARHLVVSFNNEGFLSAEDMTELLAVRGEVGVVEIDFKRYVGAQIGIHNPKGEKVGKVSHLRNKELLFVVSPEREVVGRVVDALRRSVAEAGGPREASSA